MKLYHLKYIPSLEASEEAWLAAGYVPYTDINEVYSLHSGSVPHEILALGVLATNSNGPQAITWAAMEYRRRMEESLRVGAMNRESDALKALSAALSTQTERNLAQRIMGALTENTKFALRQQLKGTQFAALIA